MLHASNYLTVGDATCLKFVPLLADSLVLQTKTGSRLWEGLKVLHRHPCFLLNTFGCVPIQATVGAFTFWGPKV